MAQTAPAENAAAPAVEEVVVTGSRLLQAPNDISISPIQSVTSEEIARTGLMRTEDILQNLPQVVAESNSGISISSNGVATVSLRGLGSQRTLVLVNGRRMNPGGAGGVTGPGGNSNAADVNQIPADLIERADVLTGGASAVYGADAVAGVVNFVMNTHYQGVKVSADYAYNNHKNDNQTYLGYLSDFGAPLPQSTANTGQTKNVSVLMGANFADGKGNATAYVTYLNQLPAAGYQFDHAACTLIGGKHPNDPIKCGGSGTSAHGQFLMLGKVGALTTTILDNAVDPTTGAFRPFGGQDLYNYGALSYFQRQFERWTAGGFLTYDVNPHASVYSETMFARNTSQSQYGPSGSFFELAKTNCANPLLTAQEVSILCNPTLLAQNQAAYGLTPNPAAQPFDIYVGRRSVESGGRQDNYQSWSIRQVLGVKGEINDVWTYDLYGQLGISSLQDIEGNFLGNPQIDNALAVTDAGVQAGMAPSGVPVCISGPPCVPWNVWHPGSQGAVTKDQLNYLLLPATYSGTSTEYIVDSAVTGDLGKYGIKLPTANSGINIAIGTEYRSEKFVFEPDYIFLNGFQAGGAPSKPIDGQFHVWEGFTELRVPLIDEKPGAYLLSLDGGYRYSSYTEGFNTNTYKIGLEWAPIKDLRLRGGYNRAVRAPNLDELFEPAVVGAGGTADPCWGPAPTFSQAQCVNTGVAPAQYGHIGVNPAAQINTQVGGNPNLVPETADTYTLGFVFQPSFIPNLIMSVDAFSIKIKDTITSLSSNTILSNCANTGDPTLCGLIHRGPSGSLWLTTANFVQATNVNIGTVSTKGIDVAGRYRLEMGPSLGKIDFGLSGTYTKNFLTQPLPNGPEFDCAGFWGTTCGAPLPLWRHVLGTTWATPWAGLDFTVRWRFIGPSETDRASTNPQLNLGKEGAYYTATAHIPGYNYIDLSLFAPLGNNFNLRVGVNNVADKNPPLILNGALSDCPNNTCNDNTWVGTYDTLGRYIFVNIGAQF